MILAGDAKRFDERRVEDLAEQTSDRRVAPHTVEALERLVPTDDPLVSLEHDEPIIERLENVVVELAHPPELFGLQVQLTIQPAVLNRGRNLTRNGREQRRIFTVARLGGFFSSRRNPAHPPA